MDDPETSRQIPRPSAATRLDFLLRALPPTLAEAAIQVYDSLVGRAPANIVAGPLGSKDQFITRESSNTRPEPQDTLS